MTYEEYLTIRQELIEAGEIPDTEKLSPQQWQNYSDYLADLKMSGRFIHTKQDWVINLEVASKFKRIS